MNLINFRLLPLLVILLFWGCSEPMDFQEDSPIQSQYTPGENDIRNEDPFAISNILQAYKNLQAADSSMPALDINPNQVYIRFLPQNEAENDLLSSDTTLVLYDYPLDCEVKDEPNSMIDSGNETGWQYCVVPLEKELPQVYHEVIYQVFIPPDDNITAKSSSAGMNKFYDELLNESARITGNMPENDTSAFASAKSARTRWNPKGRIRVWDDLLKMYVPLNHVNVHARWFTHVETGLTDEEGYFQLKSFTREVNYSIKWENSFFTIRNGLFSQAWYNGPKMRGDWMPDISDGKSKMYATIHRAAYKLFYGDNLGLVRPVLKTGGRTKICYMDGNGTGQFLGDFSAGGILPDIQVWGNSNQRQTNIVFGTVAHELGHQIHSQFVGNIKFLRSSKMIRESWAEVVEWAETNDEYHKLGIKYNVNVAATYDHQYNKHVGWPFVYDKAYSPIFIDLVDLVNQREANGPDHPNDLISQYSIAFINQNLLMNSADINSLRSEVSKHKVDGVDEFKINELFYLYNIDQP